MKRLTISLYTLATTAEYRIITNLFDVSRSSVRIIFEEVIDVIVDRLRVRFIKLLDGLQLQETIDGYFKTWVHQRETKITLNVV